MLTLLNSRGRRDCEGHTRRDFLKAGALGLGGLTLPWLLRNQAHAATTGGNYVRDKAVILVFLPAAPATLRPSIRTGRAGAES